MDEISEKRKYKRIEKPYIAGFRIKPDKAQDLDSKDGDMVAVNDLGAGGIFLLHQKKLGNWDNSGFKDKFLYIHTSRRV